MDINYTNLILFLIILVGSLGGYYKFILKENEGEDKKIKMLKRILMFIIVAGILHVYSITEKAELKQFFVVVLAVLVNIYTVMHSTKQCNYPTMYKIQLSFYSGVITLFIAGALWYTTNNSLFGFVLNQEVTKKIDKVTKTFDAKLLTGITDSDKVDCPDKTHDDYNAQMQNLHDNDLPKYNACLSQEVRADLSQGI